MWIVAIAVLALAAFGMPAQASTGSLAPTWITEGDHAGALYGETAASAGDVNGDGFDDVIVGASYYFQYVLGYPGNGRGRAYVFHGTTSGPSTTPAWSAEGTVDNQGFGFAVASAGDVNGDGYSDVIVGRNYGSGGGQAWVYYGAAGGLPATASWTQTGPGGYGTLVTGAGDVNGDGYDDVVVGNNQGSGPESYVYHGSAGGLSPSPALVTWMGNSAVAGAGDVNGDGYDDVITGHVSTPSYTGHARLWLGSQAGLSTANTIYVTYNSPGGRYGTSVAGAGDVNGDGYDDVLVGAPTHDSQSTNLVDVGQVFLFYGSAVPDGFPEWGFEGDLTSCQVGNSVAGADVNGDGYGDILVGASQYDYASATQGRAYLFFGSPIGPTATPFWTATGQQAYARFGKLVAGAGDVNGDGGDDVIVGADWMHNPDNYEGRAYLFTTSIVGVPTPPRVTGLALAPPFPNPSRGVTEFRYQLPAAGHARLAVYDVTGRSVAILADQVEDAGPHTARWETLGGGKRIPPGVYVARLEFAGRSETRRIAVTR
jgi:hypothetical protein